MTEQQAAMLLYRDILIIMALVLFIANQLGALYRDIRLDLILAKTRKLASERLNKRITHPDIRREAEANQEPEKEQSDSKAFKVSGKRSWRPKTQRITKKERSILIHEMPEINWKIIGIGIGALLLLLLSWAAIYIIFFYIP